MIKQTAGRDSLSDSTVIKEGKILNGIHSVSDIESWAK